MKMTNEQLNQFKEYTNTIVKNVLNTKINIMTVLFAIFATLKLTGYVNWSWWWVTAPLWGGIALILILLLIVCLIMFFAFMMSK